MFFIACQLGMALLPMPTFLAGFLLFYRMMRTARDTCGPRSFTNMTFALVGLIGSIFFGLCPIVWLWLIYQMIPGI